MAVERLVLDTAELRNCPHRILAEERHVCVCVRACVCTGVCVCPVAIWLKYGSFVMAKFKPRAMPKMELQPSDKKFAASGGNKGARMLLDHTIV